MGLGWKNSLFSPSPFRFPETESMVLPDPSTFFSKHLLSSPLPTNSFFQNFVLNNGDQPEYIHPYLVKSANSSIHLAFPSLVSDPLSIYQSFTPDLSILSSNHSIKKRHLISAFDDLSVTMDIHGALRFYFVRGSPYITMSTIGCHKIPSNTAIISSSSTIFLTSDSHHMKHTLQLSNGRTYLCYSSNPLHLSHSSLSSLIVTDEYSGVIRFAHLPAANYESTLDHHSGCYPISGEADLSTPFTVKYKWNIRGKGELLLLAHPLHLSLLDDKIKNSAQSVIRNFKYSSIDGDLVGVVGRSWVLKTDPIPITWHSTLGIEEENYGEIISSLYKDVDALRPISSTLTHTFGKEAARAARLALIAEEVRFGNVIPAVQHFLKKALTPWMEGSFFGNAFLYDATWGGIITKQGAVDESLDCGFGIYSAHHYNLGYFLYAIAVLSKLDPIWGKSFKAQAYALAKDIINTDKGSQAQYARLRCFDLWKLHSWEGGLKEFSDGRNQQGTSEAVSAYYSVALLGMSYGDKEMIKVGSTLAALEIQAAVTWWHVREERRIYEEEFVRENKLVGVLWANKRDSALWFAPPESKDVRLGVHVLPIIPITEVLFGDVGFVREMVEWAVKAEGQKGEEKWKGFVYAMEAVYDVEAAWRKIRALKDFDEGNSLSNMLWWVYTRAGNGEERNVTMEQKKMGLGCCRRLMLYSGRLLACCRKLKSLG